MTPAFDTSALVPLFDARHPHHARARDAFRRATQVLLHPCVVHEFTTLIRRTTKDAGLDGNQAARRALQELLEQPRVKVEAYVDHAGAISLFLEDSRLSFTDAVVLTMRKHGETPITFDSTMLSILKEWGAASPA